MSDELRAAADRLPPLAYHTMISLADAREICRNHPPGTGIDSKSEYERFGLAREQCLAAYLAEHPVSDSEPVTPEWLRSVGFENGGAMSGLVLTHEQDGLVTKITLHHRFGWKLSSGTTQENLTSSSTIQLHAPPKTRGDVRLLAKALGVDLKE